MALHLSHYWFTIENLNHIVKRYDTQIETGKITDEIKPGMLYTIEELSLLKQKSKWHIITSIKDSIPLLWELRLMVGMETITGICVMNREQYDEYVKHYETEIKKLGYELFE